MSDVEDPDTINEHSDDEVDEVETYIDNTELEEDVENPEDGDIDQDKEEITDDEDNNDLGNNQHFNGEEMMMDYIGGAPDDEQVDINEDIMGDTNKKIANHDDVIMLHPESHSHNYDEIHKASLVTRNDNNIIIDLLHKTIPIMTKYEKAKILGQRTKQLNEGSQPFVTINKPVIDNSIIAEEELYQKKIPFIIQRPLPGGGFEYWHVKDLEVIRDE